MKIKLNMKRTSSMHVNHTAKLIATGDKAELIELLEKALEFAQDEKNGYNSELS
ncbi:MAG: hypothetical protein Q7R95_01700 [bacterium]|nr:hypothetical protein [bacterium]